MDLSSRDWRMLIDGEMFAGAKRRDVVSPTTGRVIASVPEADIADAERALAAARRAQRGWGGMAPLERAQVMKRVSALLRRDADALARIVVEEQGKPIAEARGEVGGAAEFFDYFAEFERRIEGEILPSEERNEQIWIVRAPVGVVVGIIPWNYPSAVASRKIAPALIAGNTIVLKPHEIRRSPRWKWPTCSKRPECRRGGQRRHRSGRDDRRDSGQIPVPASSA